MPKVSKYDFFKNMSYVNFEKDFFRFNAYHKTRKIDVLDYLSQKFNERYFFIRECRNCKKRFRGCIECSIIEICDHCPNERMKKEKEKQKKCILDEYIY